MYSFTPELPDTPKRFTTLPELKYFWVRLEKHLEYKKLYADLSRIRRAYKKVKSIPSQEETLFRIEVKRFMLPIERARFKEAIAREAIEGIARLYGLNYGQYKWYLEEREGHILKDIITPNQFVAGYWFKEGIGKEEFRKLALEHHPDKGGSVEVMAELNSIYHKLG